jgi:putative acetyltransferase
MIVRPEAPSDRHAIHAVNVAAFGQPDEAELVDRLRDEGVVLVSLVAEIDGAAAGHILFTRMFVGETPAVALAPMAVTPARQRHGIGAALVRRGIEILRERRENVVIVVGHPGYYPRFGFSAAVAAEIEHPFPPEAFMALELAPGALKDLRGRVRYAAPFRI